MKQAHVALLKCFDDFKFNLGKKTLIDYVKGNPNKTIQKNNLDELNSFGCLYMYSEEQLFELLKQLIKNNYLEEMYVQGIFKVVRRTSQGTKEIFERKFTFEKEKLPQLKNNYSLPIEEVSEKDLKIFKQFDFFLNSFNKEQKKTILSPHKNILCIAGAGTGKTTVLTKRIEFLVKFRGVDPKKILAITFTRKAKQEMKKRITALGIDLVQVETFNSFCEKLLRKHEKELYDQKVKVVSYKDKIKAVRNALQKHSINFHLFCEDYFTRKQRQDKSDDELFFLFVNDIFSLIDYYRNSESKIEKFYERETNSSKKRIGKIFYTLCCSLEDDLVKKGLRTFSDQLSDTITLFRKKPELIPHFEHVLVDEYQDVNQIQVDLLKKIKKNSLFVVGDPRQAIYGWRGASIDHILHYNKDFENPQILALKDNYRSAANIVQLFNTVIEPMKLPPLHAVTNVEKPIFLIEHPSERIEQTFVIEAIKNSKNPSNEIFVLARTNKILDKLSEKLSQQKIKHAIKADEEYKMVEPQEDEVVLATVHSIKGMEAKEVYVIGASSLYFPNKVPDNFIFSLAKDKHDYNKDAEELRLFYVAISRAKEKLVISYTGNYTKYLSDKSLQYLQLKLKDKSLTSFTNKNSNLDLNKNLVLKNTLKDWRSQKSKYTGLPTYSILTNDTIEQICIKKPLNKEELLNIKGMGEFKTAKYGNEIIELLSK